MDNWRCSQNAMLGWNGPDLGMLPARAFLRDARVSWFAEPECDMILRCTTRLCANNNGKQSVILNQLSSLESAHYI